MRNPRCDRGVPRKAPLTPMKFVLRWLSGMTPEQRTKAVQDVTLAAESMNLVAVATTPETALETEQ